MTNGAAATRGPGLFDPGGMFGPGQGSSIGMGEAVPNPAPVGGLAAGLGLFPSLADVGRLLLVLVGTAALVTLAVALVTAGLLSLLGFRPGDVAKLTPPGRAATLAEVAVSSQRG